MEMRNLKYNHIGTIDVEINHLVYGWIPCTLSPNDPPTAEKHAEALSGVHGAIAPYVKSAETIAAEATAIAKELELNTTKADAVIQYLITHTPAECAAYVQTNVTNLATAVSFLSKVAMALSILAKDKLR